MAMDQTEGHHSVRFLVGKMEALVLLTVGSAVLYFAVAGEYELLMNPRFRWLSITGAVLLLVMGLAVLPSRQRGSVQGVGAFVVLMLIVAVGRPDVSTVSSRMNILPELKIELPEQIDESRFARSSLPELFTAKKPPKNHIVTMGAVKRLPVLDERGGFVLMDSMMVCCAADMFAVGFFVPVDNVSDYADGDVLVIAGRLERSDGIIEVGNFRFGNALISVVHEENLLRPEIVVPWDNKISLPTTAEVLSGYDNVSRFKEALVSVGLWETVENGDVTVFAPVNEAFDAAGEELFAPENAERLRDLLSNHIVPGLVPATDLYATETLETVRGKSLTIEVINGKPIVGSSRLLLQDIAGADGVIHYVYPLITSE
jgi:hypothetical protein